MPQERRPYSQHELRIERCGLAGGRRVAGEAVGLVPGATDVDLIERRIVIPAAPGIVPPCASPLFRPAPRADDPRRSPDNAFALLRAAKPDILALGAITCSWGDPRQGARSQQPGDCRRAPIKVAVLGNHDSGPGPARLEGP